jgi:hypothetical protein
MSTFPDRLRTRAAAVIASSADLVTAAHVRINALGSQVSSLTPGDWEDVTLSAGWSNLSGYIPAQVQIARAGAAQLVGHITGGTTASGTVIATLGAGYFNTSYAHSFTANVLSGAAAVSVAGTITGDTDSNGLTDDGVSGATATSSLADPATAGFSGTTVATTGVAHDHAAGSYVVNNPDHTHTANTLVVNNAAHVHTNTSGNQAAATPVNYNTVTLTLTTAGELVLANCPAAATQISFNETLPLMGS